MISVCMWYCRMSYFRLSVCVMWAAAGSAHVWRYFWTLWCQRWAWFGTRWPSSLPWSGQSEMCPPGPRSASISCCSVCRWRDLRVSAIWLKSLSWREKLPSITAKGSSSTSTSGSWDSAGWVSDLTDDVVHPFIMGDHLNLVHVTDFNLHVDAVDMGSQTHNPGATCCPVYWQFDPWSDFFFLLKWVI